MMQPFVIYFDFESLLEEIDTCCNDPEKSSTTKTNKHTPSGYSLFTCCLFDAKENKLDYYRAEDHMKNFYENLREHVLKVINHEKKNITPLTEEERKAYHWEKISIAIMQENTGALPIVFVI